MYSDEKQRAKKIAMILLTTFVLLVVVVMIVVVVIMTSGGSVLDSNETKTEELEQVSDTEKFNDQLLKYEGDDVSGYNVKVLLDTAAALNDANEINKIDITLIDKNSNQRVEFDLDGKTVIEQVRQEIYEEAIYLVKCNINTQTGYINEIEITGETTLDKSPVETISREIKQMADQCDGAKLNELIDAVVYANSNDTQKIAVKIIATSGESFEIAGEEAVNRDKIGTAAETRCYGISYQEDSQTGNVSVLIITDLGEISDGEDEVPNVSLDDYVLEDLQEETSQESSNPYEGNAVSGIVVKGMIEKVIQINNEQDEKIRVIYSGNNSNGGLRATEGEVEIIAQIGEAIEEESTYSVTFIQKQSEDDNEEIQITQNM